MMLTLPQFADDDENNEGEGASLDRNLWKLIVAIVVPVGARLA